MGIETLSEQIQGMTKKGKYVMVYNKVHSKSNGKLSKKQSMYDVITQTTQIVIDVTGKDYNEYAKKDVNYKPHPSYVKPVLDSEGNKINSLYEYNGSDPSKEGKRYFRFYIHPDMKAKVKPISYWLDGVECTEEQYKDAIENNATASGKASREKKTVVNASGVEVVEPWLFQVELANMVTLHNSETVIINRGSLK